MEIRIDTKKDTKQEIQHIIEFLQRFIGREQETVDEQEFNVPSGMFDYQAPVEQKTKYDDFKILEY